MKRLLGLATVLAGCAKPHLVMPEVTHESSCPPIPRAPAMSVAPIDPVPPPPPADRLVAVRFVSDDPELALFASRIRAARPALEACADIELPQLEAPGFVRVTVDEPVPPKAEGWVTLVPTISGVGSPPLHTCVASALASLEMPAKIGKVRRKRLAFSVDLRIGAFDPELQLLPDHGDALVVDDAGGCAWLHDNPCAPNKACMADERRTTRCPAFWGPKSRRSSTDVGHAMLFLQRPCAPDIRCMLAFDRDGDACSATLHDGRSADAPQNTVAMACIDFEAAWALTRTKGLPRPATDVRAASDDAISIGANEIRPGWSAYRAKRWQWPDGKPLHPTLGKLETAMILHARELGLPIDASRFAP